MSVQPLPPDDLRHEELTFLDKSWLEIDAAMRADNAKIYAETCRLAVSRKFCTVIDAKKQLAFPQPAPKESDLDRLNALKSVKSFK
jgi:hypothetical protein